MCYLKKRNRKIVKNNDCYQSRSNFLQAFKCKIQILDISVKYLKMQYPSIRYSVKYLNVTSGLNFPVNI